MKKLIALVILHLHDIVHSLDTRVLAALDDLRHHELNKMDTIARHAYLRLEVRDLLQRRVGLPARLHTHLRQIHRSKSIQPRV